MSNYVTVGSVGLKSLGFQPREPKDLDIWYYDEQPTIRTYSSKLRPEFKEMPKDVIQYIQNNYTLDTFYTIKLSHAGWDIHWEKTVADLAFLKGQGAECDDYLYDTLHSYWQSFHGSKEQLSLKKTKEQFFTNAVVCPIDHDYLHEVVAHYPQPLYSTVLKDGQEVLVDKDKFMALSPGDRLKMIREEIYVIALERFYIPHNGNIPALVCYRKALKLVATRLTKGWFCKYLLDNYIDLCKIDKQHNFVRIFNERNTSHDRQSANYQRLQAKIKRSA